MLGRLVAAGAILAATGAIAVPLVPRFDSYNFNFAALGNHLPNGIRVSYYTNGADPDTLTYGVSNPTNHEVTALGPAWPFGDPIAIFGEDRGFPEPSTFGLVVIGIVSIVRRR